MWKRKETDRGQKSRSGKGAPNMLHVRWGNLEMNPPSLNIHRYTASWFLKGQQRQHGDVRTTVNHIIQWNSFKLYPKAPSKNWPSGAQHKTWKWKTRRQIPCDMSRLRYDTKMTRQALRWWLSRESDCPQARGPELWPPAPTQKPGIVVALLTSAQDRGPQPS